MNTAAVLSLEKIPGYTFWLAVSVKHSESTDCIFCGSIAKISCSKCFARYDVHIDADGNQRMVSKSSIKTKVVKHLPENDRAMLALILQAKGIDL